MSDKIKLGCSYKVRNDARFVGKTIHIFHKIPRGDRPFYGISEGGEIVNFNERGEDQYYECGGYFYRLDLSTEEPSIVRLYDGRYCPCGDIILADSDNWTIPVCPNCYEDIEKYFKKEFKIDV